MKQTVLGILAHVDAGKTTLAEALLLKTGKLKKAGRVDHGDTALDTHALERERGITIFAGQTVFETGDLSVTLLDTPGHVDFSAETERVLQVLDYAVLVISGTDGVQSHTRTLWRLLDLYRIPTFVFVTKMDLARRTRQALLDDLHATLSPDCIDFSADMLSERTEQLAMCREDLLEQYLQDGTVSDAQTASLIRSRRVFPCLFGSGLKTEGIDELLKLLETYIEIKKYPDVFGAKVFKITHDAQGNRLTHLKVTGGTLRVRDTVSYGDVSEKVSQLRIVSGAKFFAVEEVTAGGVCAVAGLSATVGGQGLGMEAPSAAPILEPVMRYCLHLPSDVDIRAALPKLRTLEEEDPLLHIFWNTHLQELQVALMGEVQTEILQSILLDRFGWEVRIDQGNVLYKETIETPVEGVGHYEPLRHYAEVHLLLEPLPRGSGMQFALKCSEDLLARNWQRLILTHLLEKQHLGVLTGSPLTDVKITLTAGRAHIKHTEGGDFRQATYRAVRQGLMQAKSVLLEPYYSFRLEVPPAQIGRAITDVRQMCGSFDAPEEAGELTLLRGKAPVASMSGYARQVAAYTSGRGRLFAEPAGYDLCHNPEEVIQAAAYDPEADLDNTPDSVFCAHGGGFTVKWDKVPEYMHLESSLKKETPLEPPKLVRRNLHLDEKELEAIMTREFGPVKRPLYHAPEKRAELKEQTLPPAPPKTNWLIVDGYNVVFAWDDLRVLAQDDLETARNELVSLLCNYSAYTGVQTVVVFDAYKVKGSIGHHENARNVRVVYTKENETGDQYIERLTHEIGKNEQVRVITSDALIQLSAVRSGVLRMSAAEFEREYAAAEDAIDTWLKKTAQERLGTVGENLNISDQ